MTNTACRSFPTQPSGPAVDATAQVEPLPYSFLGDGLLILGPEGRAVQALLDAKIPVMGHLGLTPQWVNSMGGYKVQGKRAQAAYEMISDAHALAEAGVLAFFWRGLREYNCVSNARIPAFGPVLPGSKTRSSLCGIEEAGERRS